MERLTMEATKSTPKIDFNPEKDKLLICGESYPENPFDFFDPIFDWIEEYLEKVEDEEVKVKMSISYLNTSSTKSIMLILNILEDAYLEDKNIEVNWYYDPRNELSYEIGEDFADYLELPFNLISKD